MLSALEKRRKCVLRTNLRLLRARYKCLETLESINIRVDGTEEEEMSWE